MTGKGDKRRPAQVPDEQVAENWERIWPTKQSQKPRQTEEPK